MKKLLLLLFVCSNSFSQTINFKGKLLDKETNKPVVYANVSFLKSNIGISSLEDGTFNLEIDRKLLKEQLHISCLNYKDTVVLASSLQNKTLFLQPKSFELDEVVISRKVDREIVIDKYKRRDIKSSFGSTRGHPWIITKYFPYKEEYKNTPYLKEVWVYFGSVFDRQKSKFRIRFYKKDKETGKPSNDIIREGIIAFSRKIDGKVKVDVSEYDIELPREGLFIGLERLHIPYNFYEYNYTKEGSRKKYVSKSLAPSFGATYTNDSIHIYSKGKWNDFYIPQKIYEGYQIQPAISLTLSN